MEEVISFSDILTPEQNFFICQLLRTTNGWEIAYDQRGEDCNVINDPTYPGVLEGKFCYTSDSGFLQKTYDDNKSVRNEESYTELNGFAKLVMKICIKRAKQHGYYYNAPELYRVFWNYYSSASHGSLHTDVPEADTSYTSIVYYLNSTGTGHGTRVILPGDGEYFYESKEGNAIMFPSNTLHGGTGAPHHKQRWCLNVMFESDFKRVSVD